MATGRGAAPPYRTPGTLTRLHLQGGTEATMADKPFPQGPTEQEPLTAGNLGQGLVYLQLGSRNRRHSPSAQPATFL